MPVVKIWYDINKVICLLRVYVYACIHVHAQALNLKPDQTPRKQGFDRQSQNTILLYQLRCQCSAFCRFEDRGALEGLKWYEIQGSKASTPSLTHNVIIVTPTPNARGHHEIVVGVGVTTSTVVRNQTRAPG